MKTIDSKKEKVPTEVVFVLAIDQIGSKYDPATTMAVIAREGSMPSADTVQFGNTVFLAHRGKGDNYSKMVGRAFNIDTARNFIENVLQYLDLILKLVKILEKVINTNSDSTVFIRNRETGDDEYAGFIKFGSESIPESV